VSTWRVGRSYGIHVYEVGPTSPEGDRPVATFHTVADAREAVAARAALTRVRDLCEQWDTYVDMDTGLIDRERAVSMLRRALDGGDQGDGPTWAYGGGPPPSGSNATGCGHFDHPPWHCATPRRFNSSTLPPEGDQ